MHALTTWYTHSPYSHTHRGMFTSIQHSHKHTHIHRYIQISLTHIHTHTHHIHTYVHAQIHTHFPIDTQYMSMQIHKNMLTFIDRLKFSSFTYTWMHADNHRCTHVPMLTHTYILPHSHTRQTHSQIYTQFPTFTYTCMHSYRYRYICTDTYTHIFTHSPSHAFLVKHTCTLTHTHTQSVRTSDLSHEASHTRHESDRPAASPTLLQKTSPSPKDHGRSPGCAGCRAAKLGVSLPPLTSF